MKETLPGRRIGARGGEGRASGLEPNGAWRKLCRFASLALLRVHLQLRPGFSGGTAGELAGKEHREK